MSKLLVLQNLSFNCRHRHAKLVQTDPFVLKCIHNAELQLKKSSLAPPSDGFTLFIWAWHEPAGSWSSLFSDTWPRKLGRLRKLI